LKKADVEEGVKPGVTEKKSAELREARKRIWLLEQEAQGVSPKTFSQIVIALRTTPPR